MADDLVAELTLRIQNEMSAGLQEIRSEFGVLDETLAGLRDVLGQLTTELAAMRAPVGLAEGFTDVDTQVQAVLTSVNSVGAALDADIGKAAALRDALAGQTAGGGGGGETGGRSAAEGAGAGYAASAAHGGASIVNDAFFGLIGLDVADHFAKGFADYDWSLTHIAITEKLSGSAAKDEVARISSFINALALDTGTSSTDLAGAYNFLVTTGMNKDLIQQLMPSLAETSTAYNVPVSDQVQAVYTLNHIMDIPAAQMEQALGMVAYAAKVGHFTVADFGANFPDIAARLNLLGMTGLAGEAVGASALEVDRQVTGNSGDDATDVRDLLTYMTSPIAVRFFDRTQRSKDLLGKPTLDLLNKYHVQALDIPEYLNSEEAKGIDPLDAMIDYAHSIYKPGMSKTDEAIIFGSLFHNQQAATAAIGLVENYDQFKLDEKTLSGVSSDVVHTDYGTASDTPEIQLRKINERYAQLERELGSDVLPTLEAFGIAVHVFATVLNSVTGAISDYVLKPLGVGMGTTQAYQAHEMDQYPHGAQRSRFAYNVPMELHIKVSGDGTVTSATQSNPQPGVNVKINQGNVVNNP